MLAILEKNLKTIYNRYTINGIYKEERTKGTKNHLVIYMLLKQYLAVTKDIIIREIKLGITKIVKSSSKNPV